MFLYSLPNDASESGFAVVTDRFLALLGPEATALVAAELYHLLEAEGARVEDVIEIFAAQDKVRRFAIVEVVDPASRTFNVAVRGDVLVDMGGVTENRLTGPRGASWVSSEAKGVSSLSLSLDVAPADRVRLPVRRAVVLSNAIAVDELPGIVVSPHEVAPEVVVSAPNEADPDEIPSASNEAAPEELPSASSAPAPEVLVTQPIRTALRDGLELASGLSFEQELFGTPSPNSADPARRTTAPESGIDRVPDDIATLSPLAPSRRGRRAALANAPSGEIPSVQLGARTTNEGILTPRSSSRSVLPGWRLRFPDGSELDPSTPIVIGRRPWTSEVDEGSAVHVVAPSPKRQISGAHLELALVDGVLCARDLDSTNGTVVRSNSRAPRLLNEGRTTDLDSGDILDLGDEFRIVVSLPE